MNKDFIMKNKEIIIAIAFVIIIVIFFFVNYYIELNKEKNVLTDPIATSERLSLKKTRISEKICFQNEGFP